MKSFLILAVIVATLVIAGKQPANKSGNVLLILICGFAVITLVCSLPDVEDTHHYSSYPTYSNYSSSNYSSTASSYSASTSSSGRKRALTKEEAEALSGTGYHGTRPNSSAESMELAAAQVTCKECGYHSDNGRNSLCDYCQAKKK